MTRSRVATFEGKAAIAGNLQTVRAVTAASESPAQLRRVLGTRDLVLMIIGTVIGSGIFLVPGSILRAVGNSVPLALAVWLAGGLLSLLGALTYAELSATKPQSGCP